MILFLLDEFKVVFFFVPLGAIKCQVWLENAVDSEFIPFRFQFADVDYDVITGTLSNN